jgi:hypothetical protein
MARRQSTKGKCTLCGGLFAKSGMSRHLAKCKAEYLTTSTSSTPKKRAPRKPQLLHIVAEGQYYPDYWLHLEIPDTLTLHDLDYFLRGIWLECCGHLSAFTIAGQSYASALFDDGWSDDKSMNVRLKRVLEPEMSFSHEYDFGTTTYLKLRVLSSREGSPKDNEVLILAQNEPPEILCSACQKKQATEVCAYCLYEGTGWLCEDCVADHECGDEALLPVVNSPRVGECAYAG